MRTIQRHTCVSLVWAAALIAPQWANAATDSCSVEERRLVCADGSKSNSMIAKAFASPQTMENLKSAGPGQELLADGGEREKFRLSLEKARKALKRYSDKQFRLYRRGKVSAEEYETVRAEFEAAMLNYNEGMKLYRANRWFSASPDRYAEGGE